MPRTRRSPKDNAKTNARAREVVGFPPTVAPRELEVQPDAMTFVLGFGVRLDVEPDRAMFVCSRLGCTRDAIALLDLTPLRGILPIVEHRLCEPCFEDALGFLATSARR